MHVLCKCDKFPIHFGWCCTLFKVATDYRCFLIDTHTHAATQIHTNGNVLRLQWRSSLPPLRCVCLCVWVNTPACARRHKRRNIPQKAHTASKQQDFSFDFASHQHLCRTTTLRGQRSDSFHGACAPSFLMPNSDRMRNRNVVRALWVAHETKTITLSKSKRLHPFLVSTEHSNDKSNNQNIPTKFQTVSSLLRLFATKAWLRARIRRLQWIRTTHAATRHTRFMIQWNRDLWNSKWDTAQSSPA